jgi:hypothetical protein
MYSFRIVAQTDALHCLTLIHSSSVSASGQIQRYQAPYTQSSLTLGLVKDDLIQLYFSEIAASGSAHAVDFQTLNNLGQISSSTARYIPSPYSYALYQAFIPAVSTSSISASGVILSLGNWETPATCSVPMNFLPEVLALSGSDMIPVMAKIGQDLQTSIISKDNLLKFSNATNNYIPKWNNGALAATSNVYDNGTFVGVGTASPSVTCHVYGPRYDVNYPSNLWLMDSTTSTASIVGGGVGFGFRYDGVTATIGSVIQGGKENSTSGNVRGTLRFLTRADAGISEKMRIDSAGKVGIGTTAPVNQVEVSAQGLNGTHYEKITLTGATQNFATSGSGQTIGFRGISYFGAVGGFGTGIAGGMGIWAGKNNGAPDVFVVGSKTGFATLNPTQRVSVNGNIDMPDGNGVIFTSDPLYQGYYFIRNSAWNVGMEYAHYTGHRFVRSTGSAVVMYVDTINNKVGVGTTTPATKLHVQGEVSASRFTGIATYAEKAASHVLRKNWTGTTSCSLFNYPVVGLNPIGFQFRYHIHVSSSIGVQSQVGEYFAVGRSSAGTLGNIQNYINDYVTGSLFALTFGVGGGLANCHVSSSLSSKPGTTYTLWYTIDNLGDNTVTFL